MPDVLDRDEKEALIAKVLGREFNRTRIELMALIPELDRWLADVAPEFWERHRAELTKSLAPILAGVFMAQAQTMLADFDFLGVEWGLVNEAASKWATSYTFDLVKNLTDTDRRTLQKLIPQFFENQWTQGQLREQLSPLFGSMRAEMIARTEVTRAASEGEQTLARQLEAQGIKMIPIWLTRMDEIVCPICGPRANKKIGVEISDEYPPAHPRCRCWHRYDLPEV